MKIAHLILTHAHAAHLQRLIARLTHEDAHFYIHLDKKTSIEPFLPLADKPNVFFIKKRVKVYWGGYSMIQATLNGFEQIIGSGIAYSHINLLSGQDYPIKNIRYFHQCLLDNPGKIFIRFLSIHNEWHEAIPRITKYHFTNMHFPGKYRAEQFFNWVMPARRFPTGVVPMGRSQWFTATTESVIYVLKYFKEEKWIKKFFKLSWAPDEIIFQTILYNSLYKNDMINNNLVYVDWSAGGASPKTLTMEDAEKLQHSDAFFGRKFNPEISKELLDYIDKQIL